MTSINAMRLDGILDEFAGEGEHGLVIDGISGLTIGELRSLVGEVKARRKAVTEDFDRRVKVENRLILAGRGKEPPPDANECVALALLLGVPNDWPRPA